ncbi:hypothetical protein THAOC_18659, partial [Thalassiosira oceanica]
PWCVGATATTERLAWRVPQGSPQHAGTAPLGTKVQRYCEQSARSAVAAKLQAHFAGIVIPSRVPWKKRRLREKREEAVRARVRHHCGVATGGPCRLQIHDKKPPPSEYHLSNHWLRDRECQRQFRFYWRPGKLNYADYWTKHHPATHHNNVRRNYLTPLVALEMFRQEERRRKQDAKQPT